MKQILLSEKILMEDQFYQIVDQFNERKITPTKFYSIFLHKIHSFYDVDGRMWKILFTNDHIIRQNI